MYPSNLFLGMWLPEYSESLKFMGILFPIVIYEGRMSLLINTYLKTLRKRKKQFLFVNVLTLALSLILSLFVIFRCWELEFNCWVDISKFSISL